MQNPNLPPFLMCDDENIIAKITTLDELDKLGNPDPEFFSALQSLVMVDLKAAQRDGRDYFDTYVPTETHLLSVNAFLRYLEIKYIEKHYAGPAK